MTSLFDDLSEKLAKDPRLTKRGGPRVDLSLLLFNARDSVRDLWIAASRCAHGQTDVPDDLRDALEKLRPIFGERSDR